MTVRLFADQSRVLARVEAELDRGGSPLVRMPTGAGKTEVVVALTQRRRPKRVLFLVPGRVLLKQTAKRFAGYGVPAVPAWLPGAQWPLGIDVVVVTPTTANNRYAAGLMPPIDLVVVDEAHHCYTAPGKTDSVVVELVRKIGAPVVGLTATPWVLNQRGRFDSVFTRLIEGESYDVLAKAGRLAPFELLIPADGVEVVEGDLDRTGETTARGIAAANEDESVYTERAVALLEAWQDTDPLYWKQTIIYAISVGHAINVANLLAERGVPVGLVASRGRNDDEAELAAEVDDDRDRAVARFIGGALRVLVNYQIVKEGFDCGSAEVVMLLRPTASQALYDQMVGRSSRVAPDKAAATVIDLTTNHRRHGPPGAARAYALTPRVERESIGGDPPFVECEPWPEPPSLADLDLLDVRPWCGFMPNWRTRRCPTCAGVQGDVCRRCGRFRRWSKFNLRGRTPAGERSNVCADCRVEERRAWEDEQAELVAATGGGGAWLYRQMTRTQRSYEGKTSPQSRYTTLRGGGVAGIEVREKTGYASFDPYLIINDEAVSLNGGERYGNRSEALDVLYSELHERGLVSLVEDKRRRRKEKE